MRCVAGRVLKALGVALIAVLCGCPESAAPDASTASDDDAGRADRDAGADASTQDAAVDGATAGWPAGGHDLVRVDGCTLEPIGDGFALAPVETCEWESIQHERRICSTGPSVECVRASDCDAAPRGYCDGETSTRCDYPHTASTCATDADCTELPDGVCFPALSTEVFCDADGDDCHVDQATCHYRVLDEQCATDDECVAAPGGRCARDVWLTRCVYLGCEADSDCATGERCACHTCVSATCQSDSDCGAGEQCQQGNFCGWGPSGGFNCTSPDGECRTDTDCEDGAHCDYDGASSRFVCSTLICSVP